jgi:hypothetical protein
VIIIVYIIVQLQEWILKIAWLLLLALVGAFVVYHGGMDFWQKKDFNFLDKAQSQVDKHLPDKERLSESKVRKSLERLRPQDSPQLPQEKAEVIGRRPSSPSENSSPRQRRQSLLEF